MSKKFAIVIIILIIIIGLIFFYYHKQANAPAPNEPAGKSAAAVMVTLAAPTPTPATSTAAVSLTPTISNTTHYSSGNEGEDAGPNIQVVEMDYSNSTFSPATLQINKGDYVFFRNKGSGTFLPALAQAPAGVTFNPNQATDQPGGEYKFEFNQAGVYKVINGLEPSGAVGTVVVSQ